MNLGANVCSAARLVPFLCNLKAIVDTTKRELRKVLFMAIACI